MGGRHRPHVHGGDDGDGRTDPQFLGAAMKPRIRLVALALLALLADRTLFAQTQAADAQSAFKNDVHAATGLTCATCHPAAGRDANAAISGPKRTEVAALCGKCHSDAAYMRKFAPQVRIDQLSQYVTSAHGKRMATGDDRAATCSDCHGAHGIVRVTDTRSPVSPLNAARTCARCHADKDRMAAFKHDPNAFADWSASVHAAALLVRGDTSAPTCNTCHGSHGATPPGVTDVVNVCAQCHIREAELFRASPKKEIFDGMGQPECLACHSNHKIEHPSDSLIGIEEGTVCSTCHDASSEGTKIIVQFKDGLARLNGQITQAGEVLDRAERAGMLVEDGRSALREAHEGQIQARVTIHAFAIKPFADLVAKGLESAERTRKTGEDALGELQFRRKGLGVATVLVLAFLIALGLKIRGLPPV
jgi:predicted CXXCH cytochrome family protein